MSIFGENDTTLKDLDKLCAPTKTVYWLFKNGIYTDEEQLDDAIYNYYAQDVNGIGDIETLTAYAMDSGLVDKVELTDAEFIRKIQDGYHLNEGEF